MPGSCERCAGMRTSASVGSSELACVARVSGWQRRASRTALRRWPRLHRFGTDGWKALWDNSFTPAGPRLAYAMARRIAISIALPQCRRELADNTKNIRGASPCLPSTNRRCRTCKPATLPLPGWAAARRSVAWPAPSTRSMLRGACTPRQSVGCRRAALWACAVLVGGHSMPVPSAHRPAPAPTGCDLSYQFSQTAVSLSCSTE